MVVSGSNVARTVIALTVAIGVYILFLASRNVRNSSSFPGVIGYNIAHPTRQIDECPCIIDVPVDLGVNYSSYCSNKATNLGINQKVLSFSLYKARGAKKPYRSLIKSRIQEVAELYPGWRFRLYLTPDTLTRDLCKAVCDSKIVDVCWVDRIPILGDVRNIQARTWRFLPLGDPTVEVFGSRDMDAPISQREVDAVNEWMKSGKMIHSMRDHLGHTYKMQAGMWGARNYVKGDFNSSFLQRNSKFRDNFVKRKVRDTFGRGWLDQALLKQIIYDKISKPKDIMEHDSYFCKRFKHSIPFPTKRAASGAGVGYGGSQTTPCPEECRPKNHKDWIYC